MSALETVRTAWKGQAPDWVEVLAKECDRTSQNQTAKRLSRSASFVSTILRKCYGADYGPAEEVVRGVLMSETITCPVLGEIGTQACLKWRRAARSFGNVNSLSVTMYRACNRCPRQKGNADG